MPFFTKDQELALFKLHRNEEGFEDYLGFLRDSLQDFLAAKVAPRAARNDHDEVFPVETFHELGELGFMSLPFPEKFGGMNACFSYYNAGLESLSKADAGFALGVAIHGTTASGINLFANEELKQKYLPGLVSGQTIGAFALSESDSGSDAKAMRTRYEVDPGTGDYILNGSKYWITNGLSADVFFVFARSPRDEISGFIVEKGWPGTFGQAKIEDKMGVRSSNTAELVFEGYRVPKANLVGEVGRGFKYAMLMLNGGRVTISSWSTGIAQGAYEKLLKYAHERQIFNGLLKDIPSIRQELAEMSIEIRAARNLAYDTAFFYSQKHVDIARLAAEAKTKATEVSVYVAERAIQLAGGYGFVQESRIERHLRDALLGRIGEGANELLTAVVIPRAILADYEETPIRESW